VDDARRLMGDLDGSVLDLVNGHVMHLIGALTDKDAAIADALEQAAQAITVACPAGHTSTWTYAIPVGEAARIVRTLKLGDDNDA